MDVDNRLTETERTTLKHVFKLSNDMISRFEDMNLDDKTREFIIFDMMLESYEKGRKLRGR